MCVTLCTQAVNGDINERTLSGQNAPKAPDVIVEAHYNEEDEVISKMKNANLYDKGNELFLQAQCYVASYSRFC